MHDIGKIGIDRMINDKPNKLNENEWQEVKRYREIGILYFNNTIAFLMKMY